VTDALTAFIRARIADEERDAQAAITAEAAGGESSWRPSPVLATGSTHVTIRTQGGNYPVARLEDVDGDDDCPMILRAVPAADHIARQDPAATLARVAALRALVDSCAHIVQHGLCDDVPMAIATLESLAGIWRDHPDFPAS
jgi:hypothetical protein